MHYATDTGKTSFDLGTAWVADVRLKDVGNAAGQLAAGDTHTFSGAVGVGAALNFGVAGDTNLYRNSAGLLRTNGGFQADGSVTVLGNFVGGDISSSAYVRSRDGTANEVILGFDGSVIAPAISFGGARDTNLYRSTAGRLVTDGQFIAKSYLWTHDQLYFGVAGDTNLYRNGAGFLRTNGAFQTDGAFTALGTITGSADILGASYVRSREGTANAVILGYTGVGIGPAIAFGAAYDTNLYRGSAGTLKTDGAFQIGGNVGFYNTAPVAKPNVTGGRSEVVMDVNNQPVNVANDVTFGNLIEVLASLGLITNSTTA
jgi:hypothetical protein